MGGIGNNEPDLDWIDLYDSGAALAPANTTRIRRNAGNLEVSTNGGAYQLWVTGVPGANNILRNPLNDPPLPFLELIDGAEPNAPTNRMRLARQAGNVAASFSGAAYVVLATGVAGANSIVPVLQPMELVDIWDSGAPVAPTNTTRIRLSSGALQVSTDCGAYQALTVLSPPGSPIIFYDGQNIDGTNNSSLVDGQQVGTWLNLGSLGAGANLLQATAGLKPIFRLVADTPRLNNKSALQSDGTKSMATAVFSAQAQPTTWLVVSRTPGVGTQIVYAGSAANRHQIYTTTLAVNLFDGNVAATTQSIVANTWHQLGQIANGAASVGSKDGVAVSGLNAGVNTFDQVTAFSDVTPANFYTGFIAEIAAWGGALGGHPTLAAITAYVTAKYGVMPQ